jgi:hypothetical protein
LHFLKSPAFARFQPVPRNFCAFSTYYYRPGRP